MTDTRSRIRGSLLGGAVGDALGAPVEFWSLTEIRERIGADGVREMAGGQERPAAITDDTQLTLFTAEGLLRARAGTVGRGGTVDAVHRAYLRWLDTQDFAVPPVPGAQPRGWLVDHPALRHRRGPGMTTVSALGSGERGTREKPLNDSKGCGGIMRMAPVGLLVPADDDPFALGCELAALTHGHPTGWLAAGALAHLLARLLAGDALPAAIDDTLRRLSTEPGHEECTAALKRAVRAAGDRTPGPGAVEFLGEGWVADETLGIAVYCALVSGRDAAVGLRHAVNHSGDSDSTGAVAGNILGAWLGIEAIPERWRSALDARDVVETIASDLAAARSGEPVDPERYPPAPERTSS